MDKYRIYTDHDDDLWLGYQDKIYAYEDIEEMSYKWNDFLEIAGYDVENIKDYWKLELLHEHEDPNTLFTEAKLMLLLRD